MNLCTRDTNLILLQPQHSDELYSLIEKNREYLSQWVSWPEHYHSTEDVCSYTRECLYRFAEDGNPLCGIMFQGELAGTVDLLSVDKSSRSTSIGYWIAEEFQGKGLVTNAAQVIINHAFSCLNLNRIELTAIPENLRSLRVAQRLGFKHEGTLYQIVKANDGYKDRELYGLLGEDWQTNCEPLEFSFRINSELELRLLQPCDADALYTLSRTNQEHLGPWLAWANGPFSVDISRNFIRNTIKHLADSTAFTWSIWYQGRLAGIISTINNNWLSNKTELIYWLGIDFQGKGLITLAGPVVINHLFEVLKLNRIELRIAAVNIRSKETAKRLGFKLEATSRRAELVAGQLVDVDRYALLCSDWKQTNH